MLFMYVLILIVGFIILMKGADLFVDGSAALAAKFRIPGLIIGLTVVAAGTSAPELAVSTTAALQGSNEIALSNIIGSNIFNLLGVLGFCAVICPVSPGPKVIKREFPISLFLTATVFLMVAIDSVSSGHMITRKMEDHAGSINRITGVFLVILFLIYIFYLIVDAKKHPEPDNPQKEQPAWKCIFLITAGLVLIIAGGQAVVQCARNIAGVLGMTETLIGLTIVAVGTSLPELVTSVVAARKKETSLAVGNVIGSNVFNILFILGISAVIHPVAVNAASIYDLGILILASLLTLLFLRSAGTLKRSEGIIMIALYTAHMLFATVR